MKTRTCEENKYQKRERNALHIIAAAWPES